jgi:hypothetical protein
VHQLVNKKLWSQINKLWKAHYPNGSLLLSPNFFTWVMLPVHGNLPLIILLAEVTCEYPKSKTKCIHENTQNVRSRKQVFHTLFNKVTWQSQGKKLSLRGFRVWSPYVPVFILSCLLNLHLCSIFWTGKHTKFLHMTAYPLGPICEPWIS